MFGICCNVAIRVQALDDSFGLVENPTPFFDQRADFTDEGFLVALVLGRPFGFVDFLITVSTETSALHGRRLASVIILQMGRMLSRHCSMHMAIWIASFLSCSALSRFSFSSGDSSSTSSSGISSSGMSSSSEQWPIVTPL